MATVSYNLLDWEETPERFMQCIDARFRMPPPTALLLEVACFTIARFHLARRGILSPEHVSLICSDQDLSIE